MEETDKTLNKILIAEFIGTFLIAISCGFSYMDLGESNMRKEMKCFFGIFIAIYLMKKISGSYFNPAVFIMFIRLTNSKFYFKHFFSYVIIQCLGAICGFVFYNYVSLGEYFTLFNLDTLNYQNCFVGEFISSFVFYLLIICVCDPDFKLGGNYSVTTFAIMSGIGAGSAFSVNISGAGMNPAIGLGSCFIAFMSTAKLKYLFLGLVYFFTPILAALCVVQFFRCLKNSKKINKKFLSNNSK